MKPNLLFIYTDEQRFDTLAAYGNEHIHMPNLNRLSGQSWVFERAYVTQPVCTPSRATILSGLYPHSNGCIANNIPLDYGIPCLPEMLTPGNYATAHFGKWHLGDEAFVQHGFDEWLSSEDYHQYFRPERDPDTLTDYDKWLYKKGYAPENGKRISREEAARLPEEASKPAFLAEHAARYIRAHRDKPFCLYVNFLEPHMPFFGPRDEQYEAEEVSLPGNFSNPPGEDSHLRNRLLHEHFSAGKNFATHSGDPSEMGQLLARYWGLCSEVDTHCGTILDTLKDCGLWDNTIIVFTSDHGDMMGSHQLIAKSVMYEEAVRVPFLIKLPDQKEMRRFTNPVSQIDIVPTLLELLGEERPDNLQGESLLRMMDEDGGDPGGRDVFVQWNGANHALAIPGKEKVIAGGKPYDLADYPRELQAAADPLRTIISGDGRWKLTISPALEEHELYNLADDPLETENLFGKPETADITSDLYCRIKEWQRRTEDPVRLPELHLHQ